MVTPQELAEEFRRLHAYLAGDGDDGSSPERLVSLACAVIDGCRWAAITLWSQGQEPVTVARSGSVSQRVDALQYAAGEGPCLSAAAEDRMAWSPDLARETRWPEFVRRARAETPVQGVLSFHLPSAEGRYALNLYADAPDLLDREAVATGALFASHAGVLLAHADATRKSANLEVALTTSRQIGAAVGILMATYHLSEQAAFSVLRRTSSELNRKLRDVAAEVTDTGQLPDHDAERQP